MDGMEWNGMEGWMDGWMDAWMHGCLDAWMHGCLDGTIDIDYRYGYNCRPMMVCKRLGGSTMWLHRKVPRRLKLAGSLEGLKQVFVLILDMGNEYS